MRIMTYGGDWIDPEDTPIVVELTDQDRLNISRMDESATLYSSYPRETTVDIDEWLVALKAGEVNMSKS